MRGDNTSMKKCAMTAVFSLLLVFVTTPLLALDATTINQAIRDKGANWVAGETSLSKLPATKKKYFYMPATFNMPVPKTQAKTSRYSPAGNLPTKFDWRNVNGHNYVSRVKAQKGCSSCWAISAAAVLESRVLITSNTPDKDLSLSEQALISCDTTNLGCKGGYLDRALSYLQTTGIPLETDAPYSSGETGIDGTCTTMMQQNTYRVTGFEDVATSVESIKSALVQYGPLYTTYIIYEDFMSYESGVYSHVDGFIEGNHSVTIVGYDDAEQSWIVKNTWGPDWGEGGYFRIRAGTNECGIEKNVYAINFAVVPGASFVLSPSEADFGMRLLPDQPSQTVPFTVTNNGSVPLTNVSFTANNQNYSVSLPSVSVLESAASTGFQVTYTAHAGKTTDPGELQVVSAGVTKNIPLSAQINTRPAQPINMYPADGSDAVLPVTFFASVFVDYDGDTHKSSQWTIKNASGDIIYSSTFDAANKNSFTVPSGILQANTQYFWQVIYLDERGLESSASTPTSFTTRNNEKGGCFIATMAFGSPMAGQVEILRQFRDRYLLTNSLGQKFVAWYYRTGPAAANYIKDMPLLKAAIRVALYPLVGFSYLLISGYLSVVVVVLFLLFVCNIIKKYLFEI